MSKFALITGASGGIGQAISLKLAEEGYSLYLHYNKNQQAVNLLLDRLQPYGGEYMPIQADLSTKAGYKKVVQNIFSIDAIVHNSGSAQYGLLTELTEAETDKLMNLHVTSPLLLTKELLPKLLAKNSGNIVVVSSIWGQTGAACEVAYSTAKGAQIAFVKALSKEVALNGVRVNAVAPGAVQTAMLNDFNEEELEAVKSEIPMGRLALPEDVANSISFLLTEKASYITGQVLAVNGGWYT
ncbi:3-oxoacyl-[acyl-carrier protein] reductase [Cytobacillus oceanisediminis]|jgi:3-oxoacyl-[acyl-carrier protein] reductase|uniref:3-oxoacyl-[acyl-carrier protein] reductase n=1 Tax=Cytobacillus oceanisediminis TaxID=665099 RepID=A0A2V2ZSG3_9BACI|nr:SDR family oxidoreductase [Cytobacillus oceanisediminis]PWW27300.1 3-oxoacyl-[acyl-carrier protein] reductase [Cytobacillus oceanisediminis]